MRVIRASGRGPRPRLPLPAQDGARLQEERGVVGEGHDQLPVAGSPARRSGSKTTTSAPTTSPCATSGAASVVPATSAQPEARQARSAASASSSMRLLSKTARQVPGLVAGQLDVGVAAPRGGHAQPVALPHHRRRGLVAHDPPHLVEDRGEGRVLGVAADERPRHLAQAVGQQPPLALARVEPDVLEGHGGGPRQRGQRPHVLVEEAARLVERVEEAEDARPAPHGHGQHGAHAALLDRRVVEGIAGRRR